MDQKSDKLVSIEFIHLLLFVVIFSSSSTTTFFVFSFLFFLFFILRKAGSPREGEVKTREYIPRSRGSSISDGSSQEFAHSFGTRVIRPGGNAAVSEVALIDTPDFAKPKSNWLSASVTPGQEQRVIIQVSPGRDRSRGRGTGRNFPTADSPPPASSESPRSSSGRGRGRGRGRGAGRGKSVGNSSMNSIPQVSARRESQDDMSGLLAFQAQAPSLEDRKTQSAFNYKSPGTLAASSNVDSGSSSLGRSSDKPIGTAASNVEGCQICYGRKADALVNVRGLKCCPFCKRDLLSVDVNKEVAAASQSFACPVCAKTFTAKSTMLNHLLSKCRDD